MFRSGRTTLLGLMLAGPVLVAVPHAMAAQSHLDASSDTGAIADETSETGNVSYLGSGVDAWASASSLALRSSCSADSDDGHLDFCDVLTTFSNVARIAPGSSGRSNGDPVTLALTVNLEGALSATFSGPSEPEDQPPSFIASALLTAQVRVTAPDRLVCQEDDGIVFCRPAEIASFDAEAKREEDGSPPDPVYYPNGAVIRSDQWAWGLTGNRGDNLGNQDSSRAQICNWPTHWPCLSEEPPPPPPPDYRGQRTILVDAFVGDRIQLDGVLSILPQASHARAYADFPTQGTSGLRVWLAPAPGFEGLVLNYDDVAPACAPVAVTTAEDTPLDDTLTCSATSSTELTWALSTAPSHGQVDVTSDGHYTYSPAHDWNGQDTFEVTVTGPDGFSAPLTVTVTVDPVNDEPVCTSRSVVANVGEIAVLDVECSDVDGDPLTIAITSQGTKGTAVANGQTIEYTSTQAGSDAFQFTASDGTLTSAPATITVANRQNGTVEVASGLVAFGKVPGDDSAKMQGIVSVPAEAASCASDVTVALNDTVFTQTVSASTFQVKSKGRRCVYQRPKGGDGGIKKLDLDLGSGKFTVIVQDGVDLSPLTNPVTLAFEIGDLVASETLQMTPSKGRWKYRP
jgi:VCBS repeat-containing protein